MPRERNIRRVNEEQLSNWFSFQVICCIKCLLCYTEHSTDYEVHRNWLAITYNLPLVQWYYDETSEWTLDYPPLFAYFEWFWAQFAVIFDVPEMLSLNNHNYAETSSVLFHCGTVIISDTLYVFAFRRCMRVLDIKNPKYSGAEVLMLLNIGLLFVDHIHFQYNGMLFGVLLYSICFLLEDRPLWGAFTFAVLLNLKHIFLYMAPAYAVYLLKFYVLDDNRIPLEWMDKISKLVIVGLLPVIVAFGPFWRHLPQIFSRLFPFKRGLTHSYWAPNFWALYNGVDVGAAFAYGKSGNSSLTSGLVQETEHQILPNVEPIVTFILSIVFMLPILWKLFFHTKKSESVFVFIRALILCACSSFIFGWHVHEKAILMCLVPLSLLFFVDAIDAKFLFILSASGYFSLFPLLHVWDQIIIRYFAYCAYMFFMKLQIVKWYKDSFQFKWFENLYFICFIFIPIYEHFISKYWNLSNNYPFITLMLYSMYCSIGIIYFFLCYYWHVMDVKNLFTRKIRPKRIKPNIVQSKKHEWKRAK